MNFNALGPTEKRLFAIHIIYFIKSRTKLNLKVSPNKSTYSYCKFLCQVKLLLKMKIFIFTVSFWMFLILALFMIVVIFLYSLKTTSCKFLTVLVICLSTKSKCMYLRPKAYHIVWFLVWLFKRWIQIHREEQKLQKCDAT